MCYVGSGGSELETEIVVGRDGYIQQVTVRVTRTEREAGENWGNRFWEDKKIAGEILLIK